MRTADFDYELPNELIAQEPIEPRDAGRLLVVHRRTGALEHRRVCDLPDLLEPGDLVVANRSRVLAARIRGTLKGGGQAELLLLRRHAPGHWQALARLPPYIRGWHGDPERYQTMFADVEGSAAAPTAGLHFTPRLVSSLASHGIDLATITLHVGLDTFRPITHEDPAQHRMHREWFCVPPDVAARITQARAASRRVVAVGTTSVRALEAWALTERAEGETDLLITPGFEFRVVDALITNFHLPRSTLLILVSAFAGRERILAAYAEAIRARYRFYSFGDATLLV